MQDLIQHAKHLLAKLEWFYRKFIFMRFKKYVDMYGVKNMNKNPLLKLKR